FQVKQRNIKEDMEEYLSKENIRNAVELRFSLNELSRLKWENDKEFVYNGELYDVIKKKNVNGSLVIQCIKDKKETHLVDDYVKVSKETQGDASSKNKSTVLLKLITGIFIKVEQPVMSL